MVNESGASVYSTSAIAQKEFPDLDATLVSLWNSYPQKKKKKKRSMFREHIENLEAPEKFLYSSEIFNHIFKRGAVSIARRLQDPLAEIIKIDPRSIGVGMYQVNFNCCSHPNFVFFFLQNVFFFSKFAFSEQNFWCFS